MNNSNTPSHLKIALIVSLLAIHSTANSQDTSNTANIDNVKVDSSILTARGTRNKNCCLQTAQAEASIATDRIAIKSHRGYNRGSKKITPSYNNSQKVSASRNRRRAKQTQL